MNDYLKNILIIFIGISCSSKIIASGEHVVQPSSIRLEFKSDEDLVVTISLNKDKQITHLEIISKDGVYSVPKVELDGAGKEFRLSGCIVTVKSPGPEVPEANFNAFSILIPFGEVTVCVVDGKEIHEWDYVRFEFEGGKLAMRRRSISEGDDTKTWKLFSKVVGEAERKEPSIQKSENPLKVD